MTEEKNALAQLFADCWKDDALKARFMSDPKAVFKERGMPVPENIDVKVVENADNCVHITLPAPPSNHDKLSDEDLSRAAGGSNMIGDCSLHCVAPDTQPPVCSSNWDCGR